MIEERETDRAASDTGRARPGRRLEAAWGIGLACAFAAAHGLMLWLALGPGVEGAVDVSLYAWWV
jgi:hypothetical protein